MKLYIVTPIYATTTEGDGATPLVHYFAREWVKLGHDVTVFHIKAKFPKFFYWVSKRFQHQINSKLGSLVPTKCPFDEDYNADSVIVHRRTLTKYKPHSEFNARNIKNFFDIIVQDVEQNGVPDYFIGHWDSPCLNILPLLKKRFNRPIVIVFHSNTFNLERRYGSNIIEILKDIDVIGFRSKVAKADFESKYFKPKRSFICYSGVSDAFLKAGELSPKLYGNNVTKYIYVGSMIARKFASRLYDALCLAYPEGGFSVKYIGNGAETDVIKNNHLQNHLGNVEFTGRIPRESIISHLQNSDIFAMISKDEIFGLVYLEAMALGLIPIGSRNEGIDGIIIDGVNGFLCEAGNTNELARILSTIRQMSNSELQELSYNARKTALEFSDNNVAKLYLENIQ